MVFLYKVPIGPFRQLENQEYLLHVQPFAHLL